MPENQFGTGPAKDEYGYIPANSEPMATGGMGLNVDRETEFLSSHTVTVLLTKVSELERELCQMKLTVELLSKKARLPKVPKHKLKQP